MAIDTENAAGCCAGSASAADQSVGPAGFTSYDEPVAALTAAYHRTVDHIMTTRYGPAWATRGDLPDDAYTAESNFQRWLNDLLDHIDNASTRPTHPGEVSPFSVTIPV